MTDKKSGESRRKLLKSIAAGTGAVVAGKSLPDKWTAPVVDSVLLPAHAQTSPCCDISGTFCATLTGPGNFTDLLIDINAEGAALISITSSTPGESGAINTSFIPCYATDFIRPFQTGTVAPLNIIVTGTTTCDQLPITGQISIDGGTPVSYTAIDGTCP